MRILKWILGLVGALFGLVALVWTIGAILPKDHTATSFITLEQPADTVWATVRDFSSYPEWWPTAVSVKRMPDPDGREIWAQQDKWGGTLPIEVVSSEAPSRLVTRIADPELPFGGTWTYEIEPHSSGSRLTITEDGEIRSAFFRFVSRFIVGHHATIESYLEALAARFGEEAGPQR